MSGSLVVCEVEESLKAKLEKFRFRKETNNAAILMKIDMEKKLVILEEEYEAFLKTDQVPLNKALNPQLHRVSDSGKLPSVYHLSYRFNVHDVSLDDLREELPERQPRYIVYSYKYVHADGRVSYPLCFIFSSPMGCKPEQQMMYAGSKLELVQAAGLTKVFETRNAEDLTEEWLKKQLAFFR